MRRRCRANCQESLTDPELRRAYDAKLAAGYSTLRISQQDLPGALALLQEIGEYNLVLDLGSHWLDLNGTQPNAADVAAAMALSYCDRAGELLLAPDNQGAVLAACDDLEAALGKLRQYGMATQLQLQIVGALRDLAPEYACELVALPLDDPLSAPRRAKGAALMRGVLRSAAAGAGASAVHRAAPSGGGISSGMDGDAGEELHDVTMRVRRMLQRSRDTLTCSEQVSLLPDALRSSGLASPHLDVLYQGALATLVHGYQNGWPHIVHKADQLFLELERHICAIAPASATVTKDHDSAVQQGLGDRIDITGGGSYGYLMEGVALERAVCNVLLGDYAEAARLLGLKDSKGGHVSSGSGGSDIAGSGPTSEEQESAGVDSVDTASEQLRCFVIEHSPHGAQDLRPGLRTLVCRWMEGVALGSFRDTTGRSVPPLEKTWFVNPGVGVYTQTRTICRNQWFLSTLHVISNLLPNMLKLIASMVGRIAAMATLVASHMQHLAPPALSSLSAKVTVPMTTTAAISHDSSRPRKTVEHCSGGDSSTASGGGEALLPVEDSAGDFTVLAAAAAAADTLTVAATAIRTPLGSEHPPSFRHISNARNAPDHVDVVDSYDKEGSTVAVVQQQQQYQLDAVEIPMRAAHAGSIPSLPLQESPSGSDDPGLSSSLVDVSSHSAAAIAQEQLQQQQQHQSKTLLASTASPAAWAATRLSLHTGPYEPVSSQSPLAEDGEGHQVCGSRDKGSREEHHEQDDDDQFLNAEYDGEHDNGHDRGVGAAAGEWRRHSLSEEELRTQLAGLEAAMWDGDLPKKRPSGRQLATWAMVAVGFLLVIAAFFLSRNDGSSAAFHVGTSTPMTSIRSSSGLTGSRG